MNINNNERIKRGFVFLRNGIAPLIDLIFNENFKSDARNQALSYLKLPTTKQPSGEIADWDEGPLLKVIVEAPSRLFKDKLNFNDIRYAGELLSTRNDLSHIVNCVYNAEDTYRALDTMHRLLKSISASEAESVRELMEADTRQRLKEALLDEKKTEEEIAIFLHEIEKGKFLREQEIKELKRIHSERDENNLQHRQHMIKKMDLEKELEEQEIEQVGKTSLEIKIFKLQCDKERIKLEHDISQDWIKAEAEKKFRDDKRIIFETALNFERQNKLQEFEEQERQLRAQHEREMEIMRQQCEHELKRIAALTGLTPEEIIALTDPSVLEKALEEKYKGTSKEEVDKLYRMIMDLKDAALVDKEKSMERIIHILENKTTNQLTWQWVALVTLLAVICVAALFGSNYLKSKEIASSVSTTPAMNQPQITKESGQPIISVEKKNNQVGNAAPSSKASGQAGSNKAVESNKGRNSGETNVIVTNQSLVILGSPKTDVTKEPAKNELNHNPDSSLNVQMRTDKKSYHDGDRVTIYVTANKDSYFDLVNIDAEGNKTLIMPNTAYTQRLFKGGTKHRIPSKAMGFEMPVDCVNMKCGNEKLILTASTTPFEYTDDLKGTPIKGTVFSSFDGDVQTRSLRLRGIKSIASGTGDVVSKNISNENKKETGMVTISVLTSK